MKSLWSDEDARAMVRRYEERAVARDVALRVYTSRLLGAEPRLVQHGGGNTSVKTVDADLFGDSCEVIRVKGSGWDLATIEPQGLPALRLEPLRKLVGLERLGDEEMVGAQRAQLLDQAAPNPSVETLLHAFLPHAYVDHTHAAAVLAVVDQPDGEDRCLEIWGDRAPVVPYVMPGFALAKAAAEVQRRHPSSHGLVLLKHGIFSYGEDARESYERMIELVTMAEKHIEERRVRHFVAADLPERLLDAAAAAPMLRGAVATPVDASEGLHRPRVLDFRTSEAVLRYVNGRELSRYSQVGVATPDHVIRTKCWPLLVPAPDARDPEAFGVAARAAVADFVRRQHEYFLRHSAAASERKTELDPTPRVVLVPGLGLFGVGRSTREAGIAADLAETTIEVIAAAESIGTYEPVSEAQMFEIEYWSLEQAKLAGGVEPELLGHVVVVTGGGGGIGAATARAFAARGAAVAILDVDSEAAQTVADSVGGLAVACDVTDREAVRNGFDEVRRTFGGLDIVVSNAGAAWRGRIGEVDDAELRASFELNFFAHQSVARCAVAVFLEQGTGGVLLFNASKQAVNPGPDFGPYGLPKAATMFLCRQYAVDYGARGIRSNAVNADRIRTGMLDDALIDERAGARGLSPEAYMREGNLLRREVRAEDVAEAFVALALARKTTGAVLTVDGGNIAAALR